MHCLDAVINTYIGLVCKVMNCIIICATHVDNFSLSEYCIVYLSHKTLLYWI